MGSTLRDLVWVAEITSVLMFGGFLIGVAVVKHSPTNPAVLVCVDELTMSNMPQSTEIVSNDVYFDGVAFHFLDHYGRYQVLVKSSNDYCVTIPKEAYDSGKKEEQKGSPPQRLRGSNRELLKVQEG